SVAKTLIQYLVRWVARTGQLDEAASATLHAILRTAISPELVPPDADGELQDFNLYYVTRYGMRPSKVAFLAWHAWRDAAHGTWPPDFPAGSQTSYGLAEIRKWLRVFLIRFFE